MSERTKTMKTMGMGCLGVLAGAVVGGFIVGVVASLICPIFTPKAPPGPFQDIQNIENGLGEIGGIMLLAGVGAIAGGIGGFVLVASLAARTSSASDEKPRAEEESTPSSVPERDCPGTVT